MSSAHRSHIKKQQRPDLVACARLSPFSFHFFNPAGLSAVRSIRPTKESIRQIMSRRRERKKIDTCNFVCVCVHFFRNPNRFSPVKLFVGFFLCNFFLSDRIFVNWLKIKFLSSFHSPNIQSFFFIHVWCDTSSPPTRLSNRNTHQHNKQCNQIVIEMKSVCMCIYFQACACYNFTFCMHSFEI